MKNLIDLMEQYQRETCKSQRKCAAEAGVSTQTWNSIKNGYQSPRPETAARIAALVDKEVVNG